MSGEQAAWAALIMTPVIWWLQGPSVSWDQFVVRTSVVVLSALLAVGLRTRAVVLGRRRSRHEASMPEGSRHDAPGDG
jgi:hypothetical protein